jgi:uncharacterized membrane protein
MAEVTKSNDTTAAVVSYITIIGWLAAHFGMNNPKTSLGSYHIRQSLALHLLSLGLQIALSILASISSIVSILSLVVFVGYVALVIIGAMSASKGEEKPLPLIGEKAQEIFKNL